jgi:hypothetical protein
MKLSRFSHRINLTNEAGHIVRRLHPARARALLKSGDARLRSSYPDGVVDEIVLASQPFAAPKKPKDFVGARNQ